MRRSPLATVAVAAFAGCGGSAGDLMSVEVTGGPRGERQRIVFTTDGRGRCNDGDLRELPSDAVLDVREFAGDMEKWARSGASFSLIRPDRRQYVARTKDATVQWSEGAPALPPTLAGTQAVTLRVSRLLCEPAGGQAPPRPKPD